SKRFRTWMQRCYYQPTGGAASASAIRSALDLLEARAQFDGPERKVHVRIAEHGGRIYLASLMSNGGLSTSDLTTLIDPNATPVRSLSREERELMIAANNGYLLVFDNL